MLTVQALQAAFKLPKTKAQAIVATLQAKSIAEVEKASKWEDQKLYQFWKFSATPTWVQVSLSRLRAIMHILGIQPNDEVPSIKKGNQGRKAYYIDLSSYFLLIDEKNGSGLVIDQDGHAAIRGFKSVVQANTYTQGKKVDAEKVRNANVFMLTDLGDDRSGSVMYDRSQIDDEIKDGDVLVDARNNRVVIMYEAWPVLVYGTKAKELHTVTIHARERFFGPYKHSFARAKKAATSLGIENQRRWVHKD